MRPSTFLRPGAATFQSAASSAACLLVLLAQCVHASTIESPPSLVTCQPVAIPYSGAPPGNVFVSVIRGGDPSSPALVDLGTHEGPAGSVTWLVNLPAGSSVTLKLVDSTGVTAFSAPLTIQASSDTSCIGQTSIIGGGGDGGAITTRTSAPASAGELPTEASSAPDTADVTSSGPTRVGASTTSASKAPATTSAAKGGAAFRSYAISASALVVGTIGAIAVILS